MDLRMVWTKATANGLGTLVYSRDDGSHYLVSTVTTPQEDAGTVILRALATGAAVEDTCVTAHFPEISHEGAIDLLRDLGTVDLAG